jgi:DNA-binding transcriptional LysR family regulator
MLNWDDLRFAVAAHRAKTMAGAARALGVKNSTVLRRIEALEVALGTRLFDRTPNGLHVTDAGVAVLAAVERVAEGVRDVERAAVASVEGEGAMVRMATSEAFAAGFLAARLVEFHQRWPRARLMLLTGKAFVNLQQLEAELAIRMLSRDEQPPAEANLLARKLGTVAWGLYGSRQYLSRQENAREQIAYHQTPAPFLKNPLPGEPISLLTTSAPVTYAAVAGGMGVGTIPCFVGDADETLARLGPPTGWSSLWLVVHPDLQSAPAVRRVIDFIVEIVKRDGALLRGEKARAGVARKRG